MMGRWVVDGCLLLAGGCALAQQPALSAKDALEALDKQYRGKLPNCLEVIQDRESAEGDVAWLSQRFAQTGWSNVGPEYVASLNQLVHAVQQATSIRNVHSACEAVLGVMRDMHIKREDCSVIGHSRTNIPVEVETKRGRQPVVDWEVYTLWLPAGDRVTTVPKRLQGLSSPARGTVPVPGEYEIIAKDPSGSLSTKPARVSIAGTDVFRWSLQIPSQGSPAK